MKNILAKTLVCLALGCMSFFAASAESGSAAAASLRAKYTELRSQLEQNQFNRPLYLNSAESSSQLKGDIYALIHHPMVEVNAALNGPEHWCDVLMLHLNTKYCQTSAGNTANGGLPVIALRVGKKIDQPVQDAYPIDFSYKRVASQPDYFDVRLNAKKGPLGTKDYRILLEAVSLPAGKTFLHLTYSYGYGIAGRIAMQGYLGTIGSNKVGFTKADEQPGDAPGYIGGVRGMVERNTMRYYLAIEAYLDALAVPPSQQLDKRLQTWFNSTELYARQLHEMDRSAYLDMKHNEYRRQPPSSSGGNQ